MIRLLAATGLLTSLSFLSYGQNHCRFDSLHPRTAAYQDPLQDVLWAGAMSGTIRIIPVVVHIIHHGGVENISDAQVFSQINVLNKDFRRRNTDTTHTNPVFLGVAADMEIEFCLASTDPYGNSTNGIDRVFTTDTQMMYWEMIRDYGWDNQRYLNIYVSSYIGCFSSFPGDPDSTDGIFITHGRFGTVGTAGTETWAEFSKFGRTATHEAGHYLGLFHTFHTLGYCDSLCSTSGDYVCDTPPTDMRWFVSHCLDHSVNTCHELPQPDLPDQVDNYMDYNIDSCMNLFTRGQKIRVDATLNNYRSVLWSDQNLLATGCDGFTGIPKPMTTQVNLYPHPMQQSAILEFSNPFHENHSLFIYDSQGKCVRMITDITGERIEIHRQHLCSGLYFYTLQAYNRLIITGKLLIN